MTQDQMKELAQNFRNNVENIFPSTDYNLKKNWGKSNNLINLSKKTPLILLKDRLLIYIILSKKVFKIFKFSKNKYDI